MFFQSPDDRVGRVLDLQGSGRIAEIAGTQHLQRTRAAGQRAAREVAFRDIRVGVRQLHRQVQKVVGGKAVPPGQRCRVVDGVDVGKAEGRNGRGPAGLGHGGIIKIGVGARQGQRQALIVVIAEGQLALHQSRHGLMPGSGKDSARTVNLVAAVAGV
jgi:hypothetical protein